MERKWKESGRRKRRRRKKEEFSPLQGGNKTLSFKSKTKITNLNRAQNSHGRVALVPPPPHPTYDLLASIRAALEEDAGGVGDLTTQAT